MEKHVTQLTIKSLSTTRWEARIDSVKVVRYYLPEVIQALSALEAHSIAKKDAVTLSTATSIKSELMTWRFVLCTVIWYNILYQNNHVSKIVQSPSVSLETLKRETNTVRAFLEDFRQNGLVASETDGREMAEALDIDRNFPAKRKRKLPDNSCMRAWKKLSLLQKNILRENFFCP